MTEKNQVPQNQNTLADAFGQMKEEIGDQALTPAQLSAMQQKYGILAPVLTDMEKNLILRTERVVRRVA